MNNTWFSKRSLSNAWAYNLWLQVCVYIYIYIYIVQPFFKQLHLKERVNHKLLIVINNIILHYLLKKKKKKRSHTSLILLMFDDLNGDLQAIIMRRNAIWQQHFHNIFFFSGKFKLKLITTNHLWFVMKVLRNIMDIVFLL